MSKRVVLDDNELWKRVHPVLLDLFCRGVVEGDHLPRRFLFGALLSIAMIPLLWIMTLFRKSIHVLILLAVWWVLREALQLYGSLSYLFIVLGFVGIFYKDIYKDVTEFLLFALVIVTGGGFLRWMCAGYLSGDGFRQQWFVSRPMETVMASLQPGLPEPALTQYKNIMSLYFDSNKNDSEERLIKLLEEYEEKIQGEVAF
jgi:hypothetical protein